MIKSIEKWRDWEDRLLAATPPDHAGNLRIADALLDHARLLGVFPPKDPLEGIEFKIAFAKRLHCLPNSSEK